VVTLLDAENLFIGHAPVNYCLPCDAAGSGRGICLSSVTHMQWPSHLDQKGCKGVQFTALKLWLTLSVPSDQLNSGLHDCFSYPANVNINCSPHSPKPLPCQSPLTDMAARSLFRCHPHMDPFPRKSISLLLLPLIYRSGLQRSHTWSLTLYPLSAQGSFLCSVHALLNPIHWLLYKSLQHGFLHLNDMCNCRFGQRVYRSNDCHLILFIDRRPCMMT